MAEQKSGTSKKAPAYQWYPKDFLADERSRLMSYEEQGVFRFLLDHQWLEGSIPASMQELGRLTGLSERKMDKVWQTIGPCFQPFPEDPARLFNVRLELQRKDMEEFRAKQSVNGLKGGRPRATMVNPEANLDQRRGKPNDNPEGEPNESQYKANPKPTRSSPSPPPSPIAEPSGSGGNSPPTAFEEVYRVLSLVNENIGWQPPADKDVRRNLKEDSALRQLVVNYGIDETAAMFCWAYRNWRGQVSWEAVFDKRNLIADAMQGKPIEAPEPCRFRSEPERGLDWWLCNEESGSEIPQGKFAAEGLRTSKRVIGPKGERLQDLFAEDEWRQSRGN